MRVSLKILAFAVLLSHTTLWGEIFTPIPHVVDYDVAKVNLGRKLFFDKNLSSDKSVSCASCHGDFGSDKRQVSLGVGRKLGTTQSLTVMNAVHNTKLFWNGRAKNLNDQLDGPIHNPLEMNNDITTIENYLQKNSQYKKMFQAIYNTKPTYALLKDAIVAFEETLVTPDSKFDAFLRGESKLGLLEQKGFRLFKEYGCASCHNGKNLGGNSFQLIGNVIAYPYTPNQPDLFALTNLEKDKNIFRVPTLRNISKTSPYFHDGLVVLLEDAIILMAYHNLGLILELDEIAAIKAFLLTLDGKMPDTWSAK